MGWLVDGHDVVRLALPAPGRFSAAGGAGRLRRGPGAPELEGVPAAARPGESSRRTDEGIFSFLQWLRWTRRSRWSCGTACRGPGNPRRGHPDTCLVPRQQDRHGRPLGWDRERKQGLGDSVVHRPGLTGNSLQLELTAAMHASSPRGDLGLRTQLMPWLQSTHETNALRHVFSRGRVPPQPSAPTTTGGTGGTVTAATARRRDDDGWTTRRRRRPGCDNNRRRRGDGDDDAATTTRRRRLDDGGSANIWGNTALG